LQVVFRPFKFRVGGRKSLSELGIGQLTDWSCPFGVAKVVFQPPMQRDATTNALFEFSDLAALGVEGLSRLLPQPLSSLALAAHEPARAAIARFWTSTSDCEARSCSEENRNPK
jgi:hypothetical protein